MLVNIKVYSLLNKTIYQEEWYVTIEFHIRIPYSNFDEKILTIKNIFQRLHAASIL